MLKFIVNMKMKLPEQYHIPEYRESEPSSQESICVDELLRAAKESAVCHEQPKGNDVESSGTHEDVVSYEQVHNYICQVGEMLQYMRSHAKATGQIANRKK